MLAVRKYSEKVGRFHMAVDALDLYGVPSMRFAAALEYGF